MLLMRFFTISVLATLKLPMALADHCFCGNSSGRRYHNNTDYSLDCEADAAINIEDSMNKTLPYLHVMFDGQTWQ